MNILRIILFSILLTVFFPITSLLAYNMPLGIPDPGFGLDEVKPSRPTPWDVEHPGYYYVEDTKGCSDSQIYGYEGSPRCSIPNPAPAGSYVEVHGTYSRTIGGVILLHGTGTASKPVWFVGESNAVMPTFTENIILYGSYVYVEHIHSFIAGLGSCISVNRNREGYKADHIMIRNCLLEGDSTDRSHALGIWGYSDTEDNQYILVVKNEMRNFGILYPQPDHDVDANIINIGKWTKYTWILDNIMHDAGGSGLLVGQEGPSWHYTDVQWTYAGRNNVYNTLQAGLSVKGSWHTVFSENNVHDPITRWVDGVEGGSVGSPSKCFGWKGEPQDYWIINNTCQNASYGVHGGATIDSTQFKIYILGNTFRHIYANKPAKFTGINTWSEAAISMIRGGYVYAIGNSIYDAVSGINAAGPGGDSGLLYHYYIENNIIDNIGTGHMVIGSRDIPSQTYVRNNIIYQPDGSTELIRWGGKNYTLNEFKAATDKGQNTILANPKFVDAANNDFHLIADSPAIDTALADTELSSNVFATFKSIYGLDIRKDIDLTARPQGSAWDIGAYEFTGDKTDADSRSVSGQLAAPSDFILIQ